MRLHVTSVHLLLGLAALTASCGGSAPGADAAVGPNLLIVLLDTTRADHLGCYGGAAETTPTIDALAARGTRASASR